MAQIRPDNTLGDTPSTVRTDRRTGQQLIEGGALRGTTLFHSFKTFNIDADGNAYFANPALTDLIVSRVTGRQESNLLGTLGVLGNADLFFINPNGIVFGPQSSLDLNGSFFASTADEVVFGDNFTFSARNPETPPLLTVVVPTGLQYGQQPGDINYAAERSRFSEGLSVQPRQTLAILGGALNFQGASLTAVRGRLELGSIAESGLITLRPGRQGWRVNYDRVQVFDDFSASLSFIEAGTGEGNLLTSLDNRGEGIVIQAKDITLSDSTLILAQTITDEPASDIIINARQLNLSSGAGISSRAISDSEDDIRGTAGNIFVNASEAVNLDGGADIGFFISSTGISTSTIGNVFNGFLDSGASFGDGGNIAINTKRLSITGGADISANSTSVGNAGDILINSTELVELSGIFIGETLVSTTGISTSTSGTGAGGDILINTGQLLLQDGGILASSTNGMGPGGTIVVNADRVGVLGSILTPELEGSESVEILSLLTTQTRAEGDAGQVILNARQVNLQDGGQITTATQPDSSGDGNRLTINAMDTIQVSGVSTEEGVPSQLVSSTEGVGQAGDIQLETQILTITDGGIISAATLSESAQSSGGLDFQVNHAFLDHGVLTVETLAQSGSGAEITISDLELMVLTNDSLISAEAFTGANGGNVKLDARNGFIVAETGSDSDILARANFGNGGNIEIIAQSIFGLEEGLAIPGNGTNDLDASSSVGSPGSVLLTQLETSPVEEGAELSEETSEAQISQQCTPNEGVSGFVATGRGGVPPEPRATAPGILWNPSNPSSTIDTATLDTSTSSGHVTPTVSPDEATRLTEAQGWRITAEGAVMLIASIDEGVSPPVPYATASSTSNCSLSGGES